MELYYLDLEGAKDYANFNDLCLGTGFCCVILERDIMRKY